MLSQWPPLLVVTEAFHWRAVEHPWVRLIKIVCGLSFTGSDPRLEKVTQPLYVPGSIMLVFTLNFTAWLPPLFTVPDWSATRSQLDPSSVELDALHWRGCRPGLLTVTTWDGGLALP